jgi:hypothetical protein
MKSAFSKSQTIVDAGVITRAANRFELIAREDVKHREHLSAKCALQYDNVSSVCLLF